MNKPIVLFDADGVLTLPEELFSVVYARSHGLDPKPFEQFFRNEWKSIATGKADLKEAIAANPDLWQWRGDIDDLLNYWFESENIQNEEVVNLARELKAKGIPCYLATEQEKYRGNYMRDVMFKDLFDGYYITAELGISKTEPEFFRTIIDDLKRHYPEIKPEDIVFFDDSQPKVDTARSVGINAQLFESAEQIRSLVLS